VSTSPSIHLPTPPQRVVFRISCFFFLLTAGCGAPGEPTPPSPPVPTAITDLSVHQAGDGALLTFTLPAKTVTGDRLTTPPAVEILRANVKSDGSVDAKTFRVVYTLPGALADNFTAKNVLQITDPISPLETKLHSGAPVAYRVRTRVSQKRASADSNTVLVRIFAVPERITSLETRVTEPAIELTWSAPSQLSSGDALPAISGYRVYRGELDPSTAEAAAHDLAQSQWFSKLALLASPDSNSFRDTAFDFGKTYVYIVRSVVLAENNAVESSDSNVVIVAPQDTFPPAAPRNVVAAVLPGANANALLVDLSWSIGIEPDLAGYRVYRSEQEDTRGQLLNPELLPTPSLRDTSVSPGHRFWYTVTSVDRAGNESSGSVPVLADVAQPSP
jgi:fibronectin type 3 domain-containing protein